MLTQLSVMIENSPIETTSAITTAAAAAGTDKTTSSQSSSSSSIEAMKSHIAELHTRIRTSQAFAVANMELLKNANTNIASKYYWVVFILLYVVVYLSQ